MQLATAVVSFALFIFLCVAIWAVLQSSNHKLVCESNAGRESVYIPRARISPPVLYMLLLRDKGSLCGNERAHYPHHNKTLMCLVWARGGTGEDNTSQTHSGTHTQALTQTCRACKHEHFSPNNTQITSTEDCSWPQLQLNSGTTLQPGGTTDRGQLDQEGLTSNITPAKRH